jgi:hypothetical protein
MKTNRHILLIIFFIMYLSVFSFAQDGTSITGLNQFWANIGFGYIGGENTSGMGYSVSCSYYSTAGLFFLKYDEFKESGSKPANNAYNLYNLKEISLEYGIIFKHKYAYLSGASGLTYFWREDHKDSLTKEEHSIGIPLNVQVFFTPVPVFGVGIIFDYTLNPVKNYMSTVICLQIGLLR